MRCWFNGGSVGQLSFKIIEKVTLLWKVTIFQTSSSEILRSRTTGIIKRLHFLNIEIYFCDKLLVYLVVGWMHSAVQISGRHCTKEAAREEHIEPTAIEATLQCSVDKLYLETLRLLHILYSAKVICFGAPHPPYVTPCNIFLTHPLKLYNKLKQHPHDKWLNQQLKARLSQ